MGRISSLAQERQRKFGHHMHDLLPKDQECSFVTLKQVNLIPKAMFEELRYPSISPTTMTIQLANSSIKYPEGIVENLLVNVRGSYVFADFVVLDT
jgi:hypothetical protein